MLFQQTFSTNVNNVEKSQVVEKYSKHPNQIVILNGSERSKSSDGQLGLCIDFSYRRK